MRALNICGREKTNADLQQVEIAEDLQSATFLCSVAQVQDLAHYFFR